MSRSITRRDIKSDTQRNARRWRARAHVAANESVNRRALSPVYTVLDRVRRSMRGRERASARQVKLIIFRESTTRPSARETFFLYYIFIYCSLLLFFVVVISRPALVMTDGSEKC